MTIDTTEKLNGPLSILSDEENAFRDAVASFVDG